MANDVESVLHQYSDDCFCCTLLIFLKPYVGNYLQDFQVVFPAVDMKKSTAV